MAMPDNRFGFVDRSTATRQHAAEELMILPRLTRTAGTQQFVEHARLADHVLSNRHIDAGAEYTSGQRIQIVEIELTSFDPALESIGALEPNLGIVLKFP